MYKNKIFSLFTIVVIFLLLIHTNKVLAQIDSQNLIINPNPILNFNYEPPVIFKDINYGEFKNVTHVYQENVFKVNGKLTEQFFNGFVKDEDEINNFNSNKSYLSKLEVGGYISKNVFESNLTNKPFSGMILVDEVNKTVIKLTGAKKVNNIEYYSVERPKQLHEIIKDFNLPKQTVYLTKNNLIPVSTDIAQLMEVQKNETNNKNYEVGYQSKFDDLDKKFNNPLVRLSFNNKTVKGTSKNGSVVEVTLNGLLIIDNIRVDGDYSCFGGYHFKATTGEGMGLSAELKAGIKELITIPLFAIDVPAGIANVRGGIYLLVGLDGKFKIEATFVQWTTFTAGIEGGSSLCIPTSFRPILHFDRGVDGDVSFQGEINGDLRLGPLLEFELFGWDLAGAGALFGLGVNCKTDGNISGLYRINADIYVPLNVYAKFFGEHLDLLSKKINIAQLSKVYSAGQDSFGKTRKFEVLFYEACAYRKTVWGIVKDLDAPPVNGLPAPLKNQSIEITIKHQNGIIDTRSSFTDSNGYFSIQNAPLQFGDEVKASKLANASVNSLPITPTFPFKEIDLKYADFFNDESIGEVLTARVVDWDETLKRWASQPDGVKIYKEIYYEGDISYEIQSDASTPKTTSNKGHFRLKYDFKPNRNVKAQILWSGFKVESKNKPTDTNIVFREITEPISFSYNFSEDLRNSKGKRVNLEHFIINNLRGTKPVEQEIKGDVTYYLIKPYWACLPLISSPIDVRVKIGENTFKQKPLTLNNKNLYDLHIDYLLPFLGTNKLYGASKFSRYFTTEWEWPVRGTDGGGLRLQFTGRPINFIAGSFKPIGTYFKYTKSSNPFETCDLNSQVCIILSSIMQYLPLSVDQLIYEQKDFSFIYEGVEVPIVEENLISYKPLCKGPPPAGVANPLERILVDKIWSRIDPIDIMLNPIVILPNP